MSVLFKTVSLFYTLHTNDGLTNLASKGGEILDIATQFLSLEQTTIERFDQVQRQLAALESVDQTELMRLMNDLPDLHTLQMDLAAINARTIAVRDDMNQVKTDQEQHELKISDRINEVGARIGTQLNAQRQAVDHATKLAKDAVAHNKGFVSSDEFDHVLNTIERKMRRNMTTIDMKLEHRATVANRLDARIAGIESKVTDAAEASENAQEVAQSLLTTVQVYIQLFFDLNFATRLNRNPSDKCSVKKTSNKRLCRAKSMTFAINWPQWKTCLPRIIVGFNLAKIVWPSSSVKIINWYKYSTIVLMAINTNMTSLMRQLLAFN